MIELCLKSFLVYHSPIFEAWEVPLRPVEVSCDVTRGQYFLIHKKRVKCESMKKDDIMEEMDGKVVNFYRPPSLTAKQRRKRTRRRKGNKLHACMTEVGDAVRNTVYTNGRMHEPCGHDW